MLALYVVLALIALLLGVILIRTLNFKPNQRVEISNENVEFEIHYKLH